MKHWRKLLVAVAAVVMAMAMAVPAYADPTASITINRDSTAESGTTSGTEFTYYEIMKADLSGLTADDYDDNGAPKSNAKVVYYVDKQGLANALGSLTTGNPATNIFRVTQVGTTNRWNVELLAKTISGAELAAALNVDAVKNNAEVSDTFTMTGASVTKDNLDPGYYLITASNGTVLVAQTLANVTINEKNTYPTVNKSITGENGTAITATTANDVNIGDTVTYTVPVAIPGDAAAKDIVVHDKMYKGLTLNTNSLSNDKNITGLAIVDDDTVATADRVEGYNYYKIVIPAASVTANKGKTINLSYTATLNKDAVINGDNKNAVSLTYDNYTTTEHEVTTKTHKIEVNKTDGTDKLAGVKFTLTRDNATAPGYVGKGTTEATKDQSVWGATATEFVTATQGNIVFDGLDAGTYTLTETFTPSGYNPLSGPITVVVAEDGTVTYTSSDPNNTADNTTAAGGVITIVNQSGATLPSTGGMGTTILYVIGGIMVLLAVVFLITKKRVVATRKDSSDDLR